MMSEVASEVDSRLRMPSFIHARKKHAPWHLGAARRDSLPVFNYAAHALKNCAPTGACSPALELEEHVMTLEGQWHVGRMDFECTGAFPCWNAALPQHCCKQNQCRRVCYDDERVALAFVARPFGHVKLVCKCCGAQDVMQLSLRAASRNVPNHHSRCLVPHLAQGVQARVSKPLVKRRA